MKNSLKFNILLLVLIFFTNFSADMARAEEPTSLEDTCIAYLQSGQYGKLRPILARHANDVDNNIPLLLFKAVMDTLYYKVDSASGTYERVDLKSPKARAMLAFFKHLISEYHVRILEGVATGDRTLLYGVFWSEKDIANAIIASIPVNYLLEVNTTIEVGLFYNFVWGTTPEIFQAGIQRIDLNNEKYASKLLLGNLSDCISDKRSIDAGSESAKPGLETCLEKFKILVSDGRLNVEVLAKIYKDEGYCEQLKSTYQDDLLILDADNFCTDLNNFIKSIPDDISKIANGRITKYENEKSK